MMIVTQDPATRALYKALNQVVREHPFKLEDLKESLRCYEKMLDSCALACPVPFMEDDLDETNDA